MSKKIGYELVEKTTTTWLTPKKIIEELGPFDLDPCIPEGGVPWKTATKMIKPSQCGLKTKWDDGAFVFMNPPYGAGQYDWMKKFADHGNGIALVLSRTEVKWFHEFVFNHKNVDALFFTKGRLRFCKEDGTNGSPATAGSIFICCGEEAVKRIKKAQQKGTINGYFLTIK